MCVCVCVLCVHAHCTHVHGQTETFNYCSSDAIYICTGFVPSLHLTVSLSNPPLPQDWDYKFTPLQPSFYVGARG